MRLYHAGLEGRGPFSRAMVNDIATGSRGHPGRINAMANEVLKAERRGPRLEWAQQRIRRFMRHWLTLSVISN